MNGLILPKTLLLLFALSLVQFAQAKVVHTDFDTDSVMTLELGPEIFGQRLPGAGSGVKIDFDKDATVDCMFRWDYMDQSSWFVHVSPADENVFTFNNIVLDGTRTNPFGARYAKLLNKNDVIDGKANWGNGFPEPLIGDNGDPNFAQQGDKYIGIEFSSGTDTYFGWILVNLDTTGVSKTPSLTIKAYAYEDVANTGIKAGDTGSDPDPVLVASITVDGKDGVRKLTQIGATLQMEAAVLPANATDKTVTWSVTDITGSATIDATTGVLTSVMAGAVTVTATAKDGSGIIGNAEIVIETATGTIAYNAHSFSLYPNPTSGLLTLNRNTAEEPLEVVVYSISGTELYRETGAVSHIDLGAFDTNNFIVSVATGTAKYHYRVVKN